LFAVYTVHVPIPKNWVAIVVVW